MAGCSDKRGEGEGRGLRANPSRGRKVSRDLATFLRHEEYWFQYSSLINEFGGGLISFCWKMAKLGLVISPELNKINTAFHELVKMRLELDIFSGVAINERNLEMLSTMDPNQNMGYTDLLTSKEMSKNNGHDYLIYSTVDQVSYDN
ncbi:MAG: hypothetical protein JKY54_16255 [Flavobacteriales bacterium]|nr:hypothetical protein [Flavobacteriales bacterium]